MERLKGYVLSSCYTGCVSDLEEKLFDSDDHYMEFPTEDEYVEYYRDLELEL